MIDYLIVRISIKANATMNAIRTFFSEVFKRHTEDDAEQVVIVGAPGTIPDPETLSSDCPRPWLYTRVLAFFLLTTALLFLANVLTNPGQMSGVLVIGAFAAPFTILVLFFELNVFRNISFYTVLKALFIGGALSLIVTAVLPSFWFQGITSVTDALVAGVGEEVAKLLVVYWILKRNRAYPYILNGLLVGAAVGAGFAIFETAGYGMFSLFDGDNAWIGKESMFVLALRNLLAPGGHVIWAAISGASLLMAARREPLSAGVLSRKAFLKEFSMPVILHVMWDTPLFESQLGTLVFLAFLTLLGWGSVAFFVFSGLEEVESMRAVIPYRREFAAPPSPAGPWRRLAARCLDLLFGTIVVMMALWKICGYFGCEDLLYGANLALAGIASLPILLLGEAIVFDLFGTTLGKWAFSLRVRDENGHAATSRAYLRRLARMWVSGLCLGIPIVSLITFAVQKRRLSSRARTTYDEALGLHVDKGRFHPLRLLVVLPVLIVLGLFAFATVFAEDDDETTPTDDSRIAQIVSDSGLKYRLGENGRYIFPFITDDEEERSQSCFVLPEAIEAEGCKCLLLGSPVAPCDSIPTSVLHDVLNVNTKRRFLLWGRIDTNIVLRFLVPLSATPKTFSSLAERLAVEADAQEKAITGKDEY